MDDENKLTSSSAAEDLDGNGGGGEEAVRVFVRIRPLNKREIAEKQQIGWNFNETSMIEDTQNGQRVYAYDMCFGPNGYNKEVYEVVGKPVVLKAMEGYNGTVFTYGQTGSGKTWTMRGSEGDPGMMILCVRDILEWVDSHAPQQFILRVSYLEVYNEEINDLLGEGRNLRIVSEDAMRGAVIGGLVEETVKTYEDFMEVLQRGEASRSYASTTMNAESSRSHTIYRVTIEVFDSEGVNPDAGGAGGSVDYLSSNSSAAPVPSRVSYLNLVDLAGSERQKQTNASGKTLKEGANINKSLLALGAVINKLGEACNQQQHRNSKSKGGGANAKPVFIPYRDSKLTRILKQSLGGNTLTSILCAVTPANMHREETVSTLKFGQLCKTIKNSVKSNETAIDGDKALLKQYRVLIADLRLQLEESQQTRNNTNISNASVDSNNANERAWMIAKIKSYESAIIQNNIVLPVLEKEEVEIASSTALAIAGGVEGSSSVSGYEGFNSTVSGGVDGASVVLLKQLQEVREESSRQNERIGELIRRNAVLERQADEQVELEEAKAAYEEYEHQTRQDLDEEKSKLESEKQSLHSEKYKVLSDRTSLEEKEARLLLLTANLDERDSKLRQLISSLKEQQEQWQRSINDLQRREDLVEEWQRSHRQRESRLKEMQQQQEEKFLELNGREKVLVEEGQSVQLQQRELSEREQRLQVAYSRVAASEQVVASHEEKLHQQEATLKKREGDCDMKERELQIRRREMESWDSLLREKDRKISSEQRTVDEREESQRAHEDKLRHREADVERKLLEIRQSEAAGQQQREEYRTNLLELETRERAYTAKTSKLDLLENDLKVRESDLVSLEQDLLEVQQTLQHVEEREAQLAAAAAAHRRLEDDFFNVKAAQIAARHGEELGQLQALIGQQLKIVNNFQSDLNTCKLELAKEMKEKESYAGLLLEREAVITKLRDELMTLGNSTNGVSNAIAGNNGNGDGNISNTSGSPNKAMHGLTHAYGIEDIAASVNMSSSSTPLSAGASSVRGGAHATGRSRLFNSSSSSPNYTGVYDDNDNNDEGDDNDALFGFSSRKASTSSPSHRGGQGNNSNHNSNHNSQDFLMQLAEAQKLMHQILVNHNALPSENEPLFRRSSGNAHTHTHVYMHTGAAQMTSNNEYSAAVPTGADMYSTQSSQMYSTQQQQQSSNGNSNRWPNPNPSPSFLTAGTGISIGAGAKRVSYNANANANINSSPDINNMNMNSLNMKPRHANNNSNNNISPAQNNNNANSSSLYTPSPTIRGILRPPPPPSQPLSKPPALANTSINTSTRQSSSTNTNKPLTSDDAAAAVLILNASLSMSPPAMPPPRRKTSPPKLSQSQSMASTSSSSAAAGGTGNANDINISNIVEKGQRDGIPLTTVSLSRGATRKIVSQVMAAGNANSNTNSNTNTNTSNSAGSRAGSPLYKGMSGQ